MHFSCGAMLGWGSRLTCRKRGCPDQSNFLLTFVCIIIFPLQILIWEIIIKLSIIATIGRIRFQDDFSNFLRFLCLSPEAKFPTDFNVEVELQAFNNRSPPRITDHKMQNMRRCKIIPSHITLSTNKAITELSQESDFRYWWAAFFGPLDLDPRNHRVNLLLVFRF